MDIHARPARRNGNAQGSCADGLDLHGDTAAEVRLENNDHDTIFARTILRRNVRHTFVGNVDLQGRGGAGITQTGIGQVAAGELQKGHIGHNAVC